MKKHFLEKEQFDLIQKDSEIFSYLNKNLVDDVCYWDFKNSKNIWMNQKIYKLLGYEFVNKKDTNFKWKNIIFLEDLELAVENFKTYLEEQTAQFNQVIRYKHKLGHTAYIHCQALAIKNENNKVIKIVGVYNDYTVLINNNLKLESILSSSLDGIMSFDSVYNTKGEIVDFVFTFSNNEACKIVSKSESELLGKKLSEVIPGNFLPLESLDGMSLFSHYKNVVESKKPIELEFYFEHDGIKEWFSNKAVPYKNGFTVTFSVITKEKELEAQSILSSKGLMLDAISHQWRQPLAEINSILFKLSHLIEQGYEKKTLLSEINKVENITHFMSSTLDDFHENLFYDSKKEEFYLNQLIKNTIELFEVSLKKYDIKIINELKDENIILNSYPRHLKHVIFAVIQNSIEAFEKSKKNKTITICKDKLDDNLILSIYDNAGGIKEDANLNMINKNFSTSKKKGKGLGLYLSNLIVTKLLEAQFKINNYKDGLKVDFIIKKEFIK